jgi:hypothetical protein
MGIPKRLIGKIMTVLYSDDAKDLNKDKEDPRANKRDEINHEMPNIRAGDENQTINEAKNTVTGGLPSMAQV